jgi:hypothetical protein
MSTIDFPRTEPLSQDDVDQFDIDLTETDVGVINRLRVRACTPAFIADELDTDQSYIRQRLNRLLEHDYIVRVHRGLYEPVRCDRCDAPALPFHEVITNRLPATPMEQVDPGDEAPEGEIDLVQFQLCSACHEDWNSQPPGGQQELLADIDYQNF